MESGNGRPAWKGWGPYFNVLPAWMGEAVLVTFVGVAPVGTDRLPAQMGEVAMVTFVGAKGSTRAPVGADRLSARMGAMVTCVGANGHARAPVGTDQLPARMGWAGLLISTHYRPGWVGGGDWAWNRVGGAGSGGWDNIVIGVGGVDWDWNTVKCPDVILARREGPQRVVARCDCTSWRKCSVIAEWRRVDAIADNEPHTDEVGKGLCDAWAETGLVETAAGVEAMADKDW
jgi:hypothetical protein